MAAHGLDDGMTVDPGGKPGAESDDARCLIDAGVEIALGKPGIDKAELSDPGGELR
jgi:hypothetical protein